MSADPITRTAIRLARSRLGLPDLSPLPPAFRDTRISRELGQVWAEQAALALDYLRSLPREVACREPLVSQAKGVLIAMAESLGRAFGEGRGVS